MAVWVALLRAVNVSGANKLPMAELREALTGAGLLDAKTYIQSGNVVFRSDLAAGALSDLIADVILRHFGFRPPVLVVDQGAFQAALAGNPFPQAADPKHLHAFFMARALPDAGFAFLKALAAPGEAYAVRGKVLWLHLPGGSARSKLANRVMTLPVDITARNLRTVEAVAKLAAGLAGGK
jgi:uncharacterized protein (DUF1697 family)